MKRCVNAEIRYFIKSKVFLKVFIILLVMAGAIQYLNLQETKNAYNTYERTYNFYLETGADVEEYLSMEYNVENTQNGSAETVAIDNPLGYYRYMLERMIYVTSDEYVVEQYLEYGIMLFPLVFGTLGAIFATYDIKSKTIRIKTVRYNKLTILASKLIVLLSSVVVFVLFSALLNILIGKVMRGVMLKGIDISAFELDFAPQSSILFNKLIFGIGISLLYAFIGYMLGVLFKNSFVGIIAVFSYICVIPLVFSFEPKNICFNIAGRLFEFLGTYRFIKVIEIGMIESIVIMFIYMIAALIITTIVCRKRSSYL